jgi:hypothetical protein
MVSDYTATRSKNHADMTVDQLMECPVRTIDYESCCQFSVSHSSIPGDV